jgi:hemoglobin
MKAIHTMALCAALGMSALAACGDDEDQANTTSTSGSPGATSGNTTTSSASQAASSGAGGAQSLCEKYGGAESVATVVSTNIIGTIAQDCRINAFFTSLSAQGLQHVTECLTIQVQQLFGCEGITYMGSMDSNGSPCRDMQTTHAGLGISKGDFDALIEDAAAGLTDAGVEMDDIAAAAPALLAMEGDIVEAPGNTMPSQGMCQ